jgi:hypothetical protein
MSFTKLESEVLAYFKDKREEQALTATEAAWNIAEINYTGVRISDRRAEMYVDAILDLYKDGWLQRNEADEYFTIPAGLKVATKTEQALIAEYKDNFRSLRKAVEAHDWLEVAGLAAKLVAVETQAMLLIRLTQDK